MTNPDNVGGLPELPRAKWCATLPRGVEGFSYFTADQMRAYGELCRAAPAGGDVTRRWHIERDGNDLLVCKGYHHRSDGCEFVRYTIAEDSAPAGGDDWNAAIEAAANEADHWQSRSGSSHACGQYIAGAIRGLKRDSAPAGPGEVDGGPMLSMYWTLLSASLTARKLGLEATEDSILEVLDAVWMGLSEQERDTARDPALLRKLQQGVE